MYVCICMHIRSQCLIFFDSSALCALSISLQVGTLSLLDPNSMSDCLVSPGAQRFS